MFYSGGAGQLQLSQHILIELPGFPQSLPQFLNQCYLNTQLKVRKDKCLKVVCANHIDLLTTCTRICKHKILQTSNSNKWNSIG